MAKYLKCADMEAFDSLNSRLLNYYKSLGHNAEVWAEPTDLSGSIYIQINSQVIGALTAEELALLIEYPVSLQNATFEAGPILDALMNEISSLSTLVPYFSIISDMLNWGNFNKLKVYLTALVSQELITQETMDYAVNIINTVKPNVDWNFTGAEEK